MESEAQGMIRAELARFGERLTQLELQQQATLDALRWKLAEFEARFLPEEAAEPAAVEFYEPQEDADFEPELEILAVASAVEQEPVVSPPPLPRERIVRAQQVAPVPAPPAAKKSGGLEMEFGSVWLARLGIVILLTGLVLAGNYAYQNWVHHMRPGVKLFGLFACAGLLIETGRRLAARASMHKPGEVILAGGLSFFYYCTFAAHHVGRLKVIDNPILAAILLLLAAALMVGVSWFRNSRTVAILGIVLASYSTMLQPIGWISCVSNVVLAGAGLLLMLRPGWSGPGVASMAGSYGAFLGWQLMGAARGDLSDPAVLWFLPPVWVMYSLPGVLGRFGETMSDRARAWFTGANNAAFFLLFSGLWLDRYGSSDYWKIAAIFGLILLGLGVAGRRASQAAGGVNISQSLLLTSIALVIKLDGWNLQLALAIESVSLAFAFARFRGRSELAFSMLAAFAAVGMTCGYHTIFGPFPHAVPLPFWTGGVTALLVAFSSVVLAHGAAKIDTSLRQTGRLAAALVFFAAVFAAIPGWGLRLPELWKLPVMLGISALLSLGSLMIDRRRLMPEISIGSLIFLYVGVAVGLQAENWGAIGFAGLSALAGTWVWHWSERQEKEAAAEGFDLRDYPAFPAWCFSLATVAAAWLAFVRADSGMQTLTLALGVIGMGLIILGVWGLCNRLAACASFLNAAGLCRAVYDSPDWKYPALYSALLALATVQVIWFARSRNHLSEEKWFLSIAVLRLTAFAGFCLFWEKVSHAYFGDGVCLMVLAMTIFAFVRRKSLLLEVWGFLAVALFWLSVEIISSPLSIVAHPSWRGGIVVASMLLLMAGSLLKRDRTERQLVTGVFGIAACLMTSLWATEMTIWRLDWRGLSVLWTLLGFVFVSAGLWMRLRIFRQAGFVLLGLAIIKVFAVDVWEFRAFMRVISFIVLGAALILLGLFYNRFASVMKQLLEDEPPEK